MKESQFGFSYSWADLQPIRLLAQIVYGAQILGAIVGYVALPLPGKFDSIWCGAALLTFPAFLVGLPFQAKVRPGSIAQQKKLVWRMGGIALILSLFAVFMLFQEYS